eukprot:2611035-Prymnesium_polylepis.1
MNAHRTPPYRTAHSAAVMYMIDASGSAAEYCAGWSDDNERAAIEELEAVFSAAASSSVGSTDPVLTATVSMVRLLAERGRDNALGDLTAMREEVQSLYGVLHQLQESQRQLQERWSKRSSSRTNFLRTLEDLIGPPPEHSWLEEWPMLRRSLSSEGVKVASWC